jgi:pimeloyl-ACP methyl ester carboxylesterase
LLVDKVELKGRKEDFGLRRHHQLFLSFLHSKISSPQLLTKELPHEMTGEGQPLVLIHGGVISSAEWDEQFPTFAERYQVIRYDVRDYGKSETRKLPYSNFEDWYHLLRFFKVEKASVIGGSMDGGIAVDFTRIVLDFLSKR